MRSVSTKSKVYRTDGAPPLRSRKPRFSYTRTVPCTRTAARPPTQMAAGGQPSGLSFAENARKECAEEASLPAELLERLQPAGVVSYRHARDSIDLASRTQGPPLSPMGVGYIL